MGDRRQRSRKRSNSKRRSNQHERLKGFTLYLCHNLDFDDVANALARAGIRFKRHRHFFSGSTPDEVLLPFVGKKKWILITFDQKQRTRGIEKALIKQHKVRQFVFTSGDVGDPGTTLVNARRAMRKICSTNPGPFCYAITRDGRLNQRPLD